MTWEAWSELAAAEIALLAAEVREHGAANLAAIIEQVDQATRKFEASSFEVARHVQEAKAVVRDLQLKVGPSLKTLPELREQYHNQIKDMNRRVAVLQEKAEAYYPVLKAYREAMKVLIAVRAESIMGSAEQLPTGHELSSNTEQAGGNNNYLPTLGAVAQVIGPMLGATLLLGFIHPALGLLLGTPIGLFVGMARYREDGAAR